MIAYNRTNLDNIYIRRQTQEAMAAGCISPEENTKIRAEHPVDTYTPNIFICIGLFLLTVVIATCSLGLFMLIGAGGSSIVPLLIFSGLVCYGALEFFVFKRRHFRSGVDYALLWISATLLFSVFFAAMNNMSAISMCITICTISLLFTLRFANNIMALIAYFSLLAFMINIAAELSRTARLITPFMIMAVSVAGWWLSIRLYSKEYCRHFRQCLMVLKAATLASFYLAGNYYVVRELGSYLFGSSLHADSNISLGWFFWVLTVVTPLLYIYLGIRKKDHIYFWAGMVLIAATIFTVRHYYRVLPTEWAMMLGGIGVIAIAYGLIKYLRTTRNGFTSGEQSNKHVLENLQIESLVIAETFAGAPVAPVDTQGFQFGGGSGGGGGAGGQYR